MSSSFRKKIKDDIDSKLKENGFKKKKLSYILSSDEASALTLSITSRHIQERGAIVFSVFVGVSVRIVNKIYIRLTNCKNNNPYVTEDMYIVGENIGYIMPRNSYVEWKYYEASYTDESLGDMIESIQNYAIPYYASRNKLNSLLHFVEGKVGIIKIRRDEYYPILLFLNGRIDESVSFVKNIMESGCYTDSEKNSYDNFANNFIKMVDDSYDR